MQWNPALRVLFSGDLATLKEFSVCLLVSFPGVVSLRFLSVSSCIQPNGSETDWAAVFRWDKFEC